MTDLREVILEAVRPYADLPLCLSGGVDSSTILAALLALGKKPDCFTFKFGEFDSEDVRVARSMARTVGVTLHVVTVPREQTAIVSDVREVISILNGITTKTHVQCSIPFKYLARAAKAQGYSQMFIGMAADDLLGSGRKASVAYGSGGDKAFREIREQTFNDRGASDWSCAKVSKHFGVELVDVFRNREVAKLLLSKTFKEINSPRQKQIMLKAFPEFWRRGAWYRPNKALQVVSGIRDAHDVLLQTSINKRNSKAVVGIYNDIKAGRV